jgi:thioredoxin-related protein
VRFSQLSLLLTLAAATLAAVPASAAGAGPGPGPEIAWLGWDRGLEEARTSRRPVLVNVYTDWCAWCRRMKANVYTRPEIRDYLDDHFVVVELNAEASTPARYEGRPFTSRSLAARLGVSGYPTTVFLRPDGGHMVSVPGYVESARFLQILRYIGDGHMDRGVSFKDFTQQSAPSGAAHR